MTDNLDRLQAALADRYVIERELGSGRHGPRLCRTEPLGHADRPGSLAYDRLVDRAKFPAG